MARGWGFPVDTGWASATPAGPPGCAQKGHPRTVGMATRWQPALPMTAASRLATSTPGTAPISSLQSTGAKGWFEPLDTPRP